MPESDFNAPRSPEFRSFIFKAGHPFRDGLSRSLNWVKEHPLVPFGGTTVLLGVASVVVSRVGLEGLSNALGLATVASVMGVGVLAVIGRKKLKHIW